MPKNAIQHIEWTTRDPQRLTAFFRRLFDWNFFEAMPGYTMIEGVGGIFHAPDPQMPVVITPYVNVADLAAAEAQVDAAGGRVHKSKQEVPGRGWFSIVGDPDGNILGLWQPLIPVATAAAKKTARKAVKRPAAKAAKKAPTKRAAKPAKKATKKTAKKATRRSRR